MTSTAVQCSCGAVEIRLIRKPVVQYFWGVNADLLPEGMFNPEFHAVVNPVYRLRKP